MTASPYKFSSVQVLSLARFEAPSQIFAVSPEAHFSPHSARRCRWLQTCDVCFGNQIILHTDSIKRSPHPKPACARPGVAVPLHCLPRRASTAPCRMQCRPHSSGVPTLPQIQATLWGQGAAGGFRGAGEHERLILWRGDRR